MSQCLAEVPVSSLFSFHGSVAWFTMAMTQEQLQVMASNQRPCRRRWPPANSGERLPAGGQVLRRRRRMEGVGV